MKKKKQNPKINKNGGGPLESERVEGVHDKLYLPKMKGQVTIATIGAENDGRARSYGAPVGAERMTDGQQA